MVKQLGVLALLAIGLAACTTDRLGYLAEVNGKKITGDEFTARYDKYRAQTSERDNIVLRKKVLTDMVNEILIFDDVDKLGLDRDSTYEDKYRDFKDQALLDGYAKLLTIDTMTVSDGELYREFRAYNTKVSARFVYAKSEADAWKLKAQLQHGVSFTALAKRIFKDPGLAKSGGYLGFFGYGDMDPALQDTAFSLPVGVLSDPIKLRMGYAIVKVEKHVELPLVSSADYANAKPKLDEAIRKRKMMEFLEEEGNKIEKDLKPQFNDEAVQKVLDNWSYISSEEMAQPVNEDRYKKIENIASLPFVQFNGQSWTVRDFVEAAQKTRPKYRRFVRTGDDVKKIAEGLAMRTVLLQKAKEAGLEREPRVELQVKLARDNYLLHRWADLAQDSVTAASVHEVLMRDYFAKHENEFMDPPLVDAAEILVRTKSEADQVMKQINDGVDFGMLARTRSIRTSAAQRNGELGYVPPSSFGAISEQLVKAQVGQVIGPAPLDPNYVILKILGRRPSRQRTFEESKDAIVQKLLPELKQLAFWEAVGHLRARAKITMNIEALGNIVVASN
jgi:foldase protein PrsA